ncbi:MAG: hypothetical protein QG670_2016 [Thermoproteota archaeon]|nr:hypothetical protein [Thermoproteota archaeon]
MKVRVIVKRQYGNVEVEGDSLDEVVEGLETFPEWLAVIDKLIATPEMTAEGEKPLEGIIELSSEGPQLIVSKDKVSTKDAITLLLYARDPSPMEPKGIGRLLNLSGHGSAGFGSRLSEMRKEGSVVREGQAYRLTTSGKKAVEDLIQRLKVE